MKKIFIFSLLILSLFIFVSANAKPQLGFADSIKTCQKYEQLGGAEYENEYFHILITLEKGKGETCIYKEKIFQNKNWQMLTCEFQQIERDYISKSMHKFNETFSPQIAQNRIFEAKLTTNGEVFQKYLVNPNYCKITYSKK